MTCWLNWTRAAIPLALRPSLKDSFAHMRQAVLNMPDSAVETQLDWFGAKSTYRGAMLFIIRHNAEHLGQAIAYARINGIVPP